MIEKKLHRYIAIPLFLFAGILGIPMAALVVWLLPGFSLLMISLILAGFAATWGIDRINTRLTRRSYSP